MFVHSYAGKISPDEAEDLVSLFTLLMILHFKFQLIVKRKSKVRFSSFLFDCLWIFVLCTIIPTNETFFPYMKDFGFLRVKWKKPFPAPFLQGKQVLLEQLNVRKNS